MINCRWTFGVHRGDSRYPRSSFREAGSTVVTWCRATAQRGSRETHVSPGMCRNRRPTVGMLRPRSIRRLIDAEGQTRNGFSEINIPHSLVFLAKKLDTFYSPKNFKIFSMMNWRMWSEFSYRLTNYIKY